MTFGGKVYSGQNPYPYPTPFVPGSSAIARVAAVGPDATMLEVGQLVFFDCFVHGRDDPNSLILHGLYYGFDSGSNKLMENEWRNSTYAEYCKVPLENCFPLDEQRLLGNPAEGGLGYSTADLMYIHLTSIPFGGLRDAGVKSGEKVIIAPATGAFGSAAVVAVLAMGAQVIAVGRNLDALEKVKLLSPDGRVRIVQNTGDVTHDVRELTKFGLANVFFDISPGEAAKSTHFTSCIQALGRGGRVSLMGAFMELTLPLMAMLQNDISVKAKWMYTKEDMRFLIKLAESGYLKLGQAGGIQTTGSFPLEQFEAAFNAAAKSSGPSMQTIIVP
jgi:threonine dehydrogenase-like Zn-dependent dehydrogenase